MNQSSNAPDPGSDLVADRRRKLDRLRDELHVDPYGQRIDGLISLAAARALHDPTADEAHKNDSSVDDRPVVHVAGRVVLHRAMGNLIFMTLRDDTGDLQVAVSKKSVDPNSFNQAAKLTDLGDIVTARGPIGTTKTGEITVWAAGEGGYAMACKSLAPPPEKWKGLQDAELRYRRRYVDMYANPPVIATFKTRSRIVSEIRRFLTDRDFLEVETPMLQPMAGGAAARPFVTHHNALDIDLFMRIAPELYLKRLLVGGLPRVFEINRNFRNEGVDRSHNPEFTMLELYQAFGDYDAMMRLTESLIHHLVMMLFPESNGVVTFDELTIDFTAPFAREKYLDLFEKHNGFPASDHDQLAARAGTLGITAAGKDHDLLLNEVWEATVESQLVQPTFVIDYPASLCPLTKRKADDPNIAERFELFVANMELANAYTELNDPDVQLANFQQQIQGQDEEESTFRAMDDDFINALQVGMPPAGGLGIGIDRLIMLLTNHRSIRDVILFPLMRPKTTGE